MNTTTYPTTTNDRFKCLIDAVNTPTPIDLETQPYNNYSYDAVGNMIEDKSRQMHVYYTYSNKPKIVNFANKTIKILL